MAADYTLGMSWEMLTTRERLGIGDEVKQSFLNWMEEEEIDRQAKYRQYREYYNGEQNAQLTDRQADFMELDTDQEFSLNLCGLVVDQLERRMSVAGFDAPGELGGKEGLLWTWWKKEKMDARQSAVHLSAVRDGDTYVIVSWDQELGRPRFSPNMAFDGTEGVRIHYSDETDEIVAATKRWVVRTFNNDGVGERRRMNIYYPDRIERYISDESLTGGSWKLYTLDGQDGILDWTDERGRPLGVPVKHLPYKAGGYRFGKSILEDVIPLQNLLNKAVIDVIAAADTTAFRIYWATGTDVTDEDDTPIKIHPGTFITSDNPDARFGYLQGEDLRPMIEVVDMFKVSIAQVSETPLHLFQVSGQNASEGAQKQQEVGMINKAEKWGIAVGNFWEDVMQCAIRLSNAFDRTSYPEDEILETMWNDMEVRDKTQRRKDVAETAKTWTDAGADIEQAAIEAGVAEHRAQEIGSTAMPIQAMPIPVAGEDNAEAPDTA